jgi:hypothetical protein
MKSDDLEMSMLSREARTMHGYMRYARQAQQRAWVQDQLSKNTQLLGRRVVFSNMPEVVTGTVTGQVANTVLVNWDDSPVKGWVTLDSPCLLNKDELTTPTTP